MPTPMDSENLISAVTNLQLLAALVVDLGADAECREDSLTQAPAPEPAATSAAALQAKGGHHAMMATDFRICMRVDEKHAISWFTLANHCDQTAARYQRLAALQSGTETAILR